MFVYLFCQSQEAVGVERGLEEEEEAGEEGGEDDGEEGGGGVAMETPNGPVYCVCRKADINCFMM